MQVNGDNASEVVDGFVAIGELLDLINNPPPPENTVPDDEPINP